MTAKEVCAQFAISQKILTALRRRGFLSTNGSRSYDPEAVKTALSRVIIRKK